METNEKEINESTSAKIDTGHGGARTGSGRKLGATSKLTAKQIMETCEQITGKPLVVNLIEGYYNTILSEDYKNRVIYEKMLLDKCATTLLDVEVSDTTQAMEAKQAAFLAALQALQNVGKDQD